jgi:hypothetical protein
MLNPPALIVLILAGPIPVTRLRRSSASRKRPPVSRAAMIRWAVRGPMPFTCSSSAALAVLTSIRSAPACVNSAGGEVGSTGRRSPRAGEPPAWHSLTRTGTARSVALIRLTESARRMNAPKGAGEADSWLIVISGEGGESEPAAQSCGTCCQAPAAWQGLASVGPPGARSADVALHGHPSRPSRLPDDRPNRQGIGLGRLALPALDGGDTVWAQIQTVPHWPGSSADRARRSSPI